MLQKNTLVEKCSAQFQKIFGERNIHADGKIIVSHFGEFSKDLVNSLSTSIQDMMLDSGDKKTAVKRMFSILVEGLQNIRIHGERDQDNNQVSFLIVLQKEEDYDVTFGNLVHQNTVGKLTNRIDELNNHTQEEIKEMYMDTLSNGIMSSKGGAGLGFITIALKSQNKIGYEKIQVADDLYFFTLSIRIERVRK